MRQARWTPEMEKTRLLYRKWLKWTLLISLFSIVLWFVVSLLFWFGAQVFAGDLAGSVGVGISVEGGDGVSVFAMLRRTLTIILAFVASVAIIILLALIGIYPWVILNKRAGLPGRGVVVPVYNTLLYCDLAKVSRWWALFLLVPYLNFIGFAVLNFRIAKNFGQSDAFAVGAIFFPFIFFPILAASRAEWGGVITGSTKKLTNLDLEIAELERIKKKKQLEKEIRDLED